MPTSSRSGWDFMLKRAELVWQGAAGLGDTIDHRQPRSRAGARTSFVVRHDLSVGERPVLEADITYVGVEAGHQPADRRRPTRSAAISADPTRP